MADHGLKIGSDIELNDDGELSLTSKYSALKLYLWGDTSFTTDGSGDGSVTISHDLNYAPAYFVFNKTTAEWTFLTGATTYPDSFLQIGATNWYSGEDFHHALSAHTTSSDLVIESIGGTASKTYDFRYYLLADSSEVFSGVDGMSTPNNYGLKIAKTAGSVIGGKQFDLGFSTKFKMLQYYDALTFSEDVTLPAMWASKYDTFVEEAGYVDFTHNLGYAPFFIAYVRVYSTVLSAYINLEVPYYEENSSDIINFNVAGFADATRVRLYAWRSSSYSSISGGPIETWDEDTFTLKCIVFTEDLTKAAP